jgi:primosomal protein N' (replication factor Y)
MPAVRVRVAVPLPVTGTFTYSVPDELAERAVVGVRVLVPFGRRKITGYVVGREGEPEVEDVKEILDVLDLRPALSSRMIELTRRVSEYYLAPWGEVIRAALPPGTSVGTRLSIRATEAGREALARGARGLSDARRRILEATAGRGCLSVPAACRTAGARRGSRSDVDALVRAGFLELVDEVRRAQTEGGREGIVRLAVDRAAALAEAARISKTAPRQAELLAVLAGIDGGAGATSELAEKGFGPAIVSRLAARGTVVRAEREKPRLSTGLEGWALREEGAPTAEQESALALIRRRLQASEFGVVLLHGVTGSGKTRVYSEAIRAARAVGKGAIILVPEISLTPQMVLRMRMEFGEEVAVVHSGLSLAERYDTWRAIRDGVFSVVVGPRSAVFAPVANLGVVVVDEEHEQTYKQSESPRYHARDVAVMRAKLERAVVILGSATPSMESYLNAHEGKYDLVELPLRIDAGPLPEVEVVDMRTEATVDSEGAFSRRLKEAVAETLAARRQVILFLNRRGHASFVQCLGCGHTQRCPDCNVSLTFHSTNHSLRCHYCGFSITAPDKCPQCGGVDLRFGAPGTQRVERAVRELFPDAAVARMDLDTTRAQGAHWRMLKAFADGATDILLGTQMIAKGLDFPRVGLVGVVSADVGLNLPDFRAGERTFQLLTQVAGRTGRGAERGRVVVQSYLPEHYTIALARDQLFTPFFERESAERGGAGLGYPPFARLVGILVKGRDQAGVMKAAGRVADFLDRGAAKMKDPKPEVLGPAPAPLERIKGAYRWQVIVRGKGTAARALVAGALAQKASLKLPSAVSLSVDVDPQDLL